ncbi:xyloglucan endotransglucosylase/hydrolase protein 9-like isoform X1 [Punica granatum]|nr:xyloglucan endotransglucosylase/hydrolase protein 9-like isoform X1 [Punica granatum]
MVMTFVFSLLLLLVGPAICGGTFSDLFQPYWAPQNVAVDDDADQTKLSLDASSGCGFESKKKYLFGLASMQIKLVEGDSAGTVTAFYMSSDGPNHDELDFEFLGNVSGEPYLVQTNVYVNGTGNREQRHTLWFDPTQDFHTYSLFWNRRCVLFLVDGIPIRAFVSKEVSGIPYPRSQPMGVRASVWNADDWATQGGRVKTDWSHAPFVSTFRSFQIDACDLLEDGSGTEVVTRCTESGQFWWDKPEFDGLDRHRNRQLRRVQRKHLVYDYCRDKLRFSDQLPRECVA